VVGLRANHLDLVGHALEIGGLEPVDGEGDVGFELGLRRATVGGEANDLRRCRNPRTSCSGSFATSSTAMSA
jgi:hypothetical protein